MNLTRFDIPGITYPLAFAVAACIGGVCEQLRLYNERILPRAKRALQLASADYRGRLVDFGEVANGFTEVLMFELQVARTKSALAGTVAQLHRAIGWEVIVGDQ